MVFNDCIYEFSALTADDNMHVGGIPHRNPSGRLEEY
jgi:hypothetical protein